MRKLQRFDDLEEAILKLCELIDREAKYPVENVPHKKRGIRAARYDFAPIRNLCEQLGKEIPLTDRQQELAITLVTKYHKQWRKRGYDVTNINKDFPTRYVIRRNIDRSVTANFDGRHVILKFPYKPKLISQLSDAANRANGEMIFDSDQKCWKLVPTAANVAWVNKFVTDQKFEISQEFKDLVKQFDNAYDYRSIQLDIVDDALVLHDAPPTMVAWIEENIGNIDMSNFLQLVSSHHLLQYTRSQAIFDYVYSNYPDASEMILMPAFHTGEKHMKFEELLKAVIPFDYRNIVLFAADKNELNTMYAHCRNVLPRHNIAMEEQNGYDPEDCKYNIYITTKVLPITPDLIISTAGFFAGAARRSWFDTAKKTIFYCPDVDYTVKRRIKKHESDINNQRRS